MLICLPRKGNLGGKEENTIFFLPYDTQIPSVCREGQSAVGGCKGERLILLTDASKKCMYVCMYVCGKEGRKGRWRGAMREIVMMMMMMIVVVVMITFVN